MLDGDSTRAATFEKPSVDVISTERMVCQKYVSGIQVSAYPQQAKGWIRARSVGFVEHAGLSNVVPAACE